jgi:hypothetical protein
VGFEPTVQYYPYNRLASDRLRPLGHLSGIGPIGPIGLIPRERRAQDSNPQDPSLSRQISSLLPYQLG